MQIANGMVILSPENHQFKHDITPGEALIIHKLHFQYANGNPLGEFVIQPDEAQTIDSDGKPAEEAWFNQQSGKHIEAKPAVPAKTHKRTQAEEISRLKRKYTGNITENGAARPAFEATFGQSVGVRLPETFEEIVPVVGNHFHKKVEDAVHSDDRKREIELVGKTRPELVSIALKLGITTHQADSTGFIIAAIINEENKAQLQGLQDEVESEKPRKGKKNQEVESVT